MRRRVGALAALAALTSLALPARSQDADTFEQTYLRIHQSLTYIEGKAYDDLDRPAVSIGTGFIVSSTPPGVEPAYTYILTAGHVVSLARYARVTLNDAFPTPDPANGVNDDGSIEAKVVFIETDPNPRARLQQRVDLALLRIPIGGLPPVYLPYEAIEGASVGVAGYPASSIDAKGQISDLRPVVHDGIVSAVREDGGLIEHTAVTDHGISGGPLFETQTGGVIGVVDGEWCPPGEEKCKHNADLSGVYLAIGYRIVESFLHDANDCIRSGTLGRSGAQRCYADSSETNQMVSMLTYSQVQQRHVDFHLTSAYSLLALDDASMDPSLAPDFGASFARRLHDAIAPHAFGHDVRVDPSATSIDFERPSTGTSVRTELATLCGTRYMGAVIAHAHLLPAGGKYPQPRLWMYLSLMSCSGTDWTSQRSIRALLSLDPGSSLASVEDEGIGDLLRSLDDAIDFRPLSFDNYLRYGFYTTQGEKRTYFNFDLDESGAVRVIWVAAGGCAERAGLQVGEALDRINGHPIGSGITEGELDKYRNEFHAVWTLGITGIAAPISFRAEDMRWLLSHPDPRTPCI